MEIINVKDRLPEKEKYVLVRYNGGNWHCNSDPEGCLWKVAKFRRGLSYDEREKLPNDDPRKRTYEKADQDGNNLLPYIWDEFGLGILFGHEVDYWCELPRLNDK